jgi:hypothetical protein
MFVSASTCRKLWCMASFLVVFLLVAGCAGVTPYEPRNDREEGPEKGLFTGSEGKFVIHRAEEPEIDDKDEKEVHEPADDENPQGEQRQSQGHQ